MTISYHCEDCGATATQGVDELGGEGALHCAAHPGATINSVVSVAKKPTKKPTTSDEIKSHAETDARASFDMDSDMARQYLANVASGLALELAGLANSAQRSALMVAAGVRRVDARAFNATYNAAWVAEMARLAAAVQP